MSKKKILRIIAVSFVILVQCGLNNLVRGMEKEDEGDIKMAIRAIQAHRYYISDWIGSSFNSLGVKHNSTAGFLENQQLTLNERRKKLTTELPPYMSIHHTDAERVNGVNPVIASSHFLFGLIDIPQGCPACERAYSTISENILKNYEIKEIKRKEHKEEKNNMELPFISLQEKNEENNNKLNSLTIHSGPLKAAFGFPPTDWQPYTNTSWAPVVFTWFEGDEKLKGNMSIIEIPEDGVYSLYTICRWAAKNGRATPETAIKLNKSITEGFYFSRNTIENGCEASHSINRVTRLKKGETVMVSILGDPNALYFLGHFHFQIEKIEDTNLERQVLFLEKENNELKQYFNNLFQQKYEESQKDINELKECVTFLKEENKTLKKENNIIKKIFAILPSTNECELFNMSEEKFLNEISLTEKIPLLYRSACSLHNTIKSLKQKANELGLEELEDKNIISVPTQIISEDQVPEYCVSILLKKDPQIFLPWISTKTVFEAILNEVSLEKNSLPTHILVEDEESKEGGILLSSYIKRELEHGLDAKISIEGKNKFENMVFDIEKIQGDFWKENESISVPILLKKLNEGDGDKEWVPGWSNLEEAYKKYIAATVLYKMSKSKRSLPKKYEDIESYLMDR